MDNNEGEAMKTIPCKLKSKAARTAAREVLAQIQERRPNDYARLLTKVREIAPYNGDDERCLGQWVRDGGWSGFPEDETGIVLIREGRYNTVEALRAIAAHELGHAATRYEDLLRRGDLDTDEWSSEFTADWYAYRWGFGREVAKHRKHMDWMHHGVGPGGAFEIGGPDGWYHFKVTRNFVAHFTHKTPLEAADGAE